MSWQRGNRVTAAHDLSDTVAFIPAGTLGTIVAIEVHRGGHGLAYTVTFHDDAALRPITLTGLSSTDLTSH